MLDLDDADRSPLDLAGLLDNLPGMVYRCRADRVWTLDFVSGGSLALTGYRPDELLTGERRAFAELIVPMDRRAVELAIEAAVASGQPYTIEYRICDRAGRIRQVWERGRLVRGEGPSAVLEGFITDISPLRRVEFDLRERIKEIECLYDVSAITGADLPLDEALWRIVERIPGGYCYPPEVAARITIDDRVYAAPQFTAEKPLQRAPIVLSGRVAGAVEVCRFAGDEPVPEGYFLREEQNMLDAVAARIADRIERARMVAALQESERRARDLYEHLPIPTAVWRRQGDTYVLSDHNRAALVATEGRVRGWIGRDCRELLPGRPDLVDLLAACVGSRTPSWREIEFTLPDGRALVLAVALGFVPPDLVLAHVIDVTRERSVERRLQEAQKMEVLGRMAAGVAHDFNNFFTVILGYTNLFIAGARPDGSVRVDLADVEEIRTASQRAAALTRQLLTFSRREAVQPVPIDVSAKVRELRGVLARLLGEDRKLTFALASAPCTVEIGAGQLDQVLVNLIVNARDATCPGGHVIIVTADVPADEAARLELPPEPHVVLTVSDDGCGMDAATRRRIFEPFFTTKAPGLGSGMGLSIVYGIVRQAGGRITVESEPRRGATFRIYLPRASTPAPAPDLMVRGPRQAGAGGETILVIEDDEAVRRLVARVLAGAGYRVLTASDAAEALLVCERHGRGIDLLITDLVLPWTTGTALAAEIAALLPGIRVLFMSGYAERARQAAEEAVTAAHFIAKPFTDEALLTLVERILGSERTTAQ